MKSINLIKSMISTSVLLVLIIVSAGAQWLPQKTGLPDDIEGIYNFSAVDATTVWAIPFSFSGCHKLVKSVDGGKTWKVITVTGGEGLAFADIHALDENNVWVAMWPSGISSNSAIFYSSDGGETWAQQETAFFNTSGYVAFIHFFNEKEGITVGDPNGGQFEMYYTRNGGEKWQAVSIKNIPMPNIGEAAVAGNFETNGNTIWFGTTKGRVFRSTNHGVNWTASEPLWNGAVSCAFQDETTGLAVSNGNSDLKPSLMQTFDGGLTWTPLDSAPPLSGFIEFVPGSKDSYVIAGTGKKGTDKGSAYTIDGGKTWVLVDDVEHFSSVFISPQHGYIGSDKTVLYKWVGPVLEEETDAEKAKKVIN